MTTSGNAWALERPHRGAVVRRPAGGAWLLAAAALLIALPWFAGLPASDRATIGQTLRLNVGARGYALDGQPVTPPQLERVLRQARGRSPAVRLRIEAEPGDPRRLSDALALADEAGIRNVGSQLR